MTRAAFACVTLVLAATAGVAARGEDTPPPKVTVAAPVEQTVTFEATGHAAAVSSVDLVARVPGFVQEIGYTDGAFVKKGTPLFTIEPEPYGLKMETAKSVVSGAEAKLRQAEADFKRQAELMAEQSTAASVYDRALAQLDTARTELQSAQADERAAEINLGYTKVTAPIDGVVTERRVRWASSSVPFSDVQRCWPPSCSSTLST